MRSPFSSFSTNSYPSLSQNMKILSFRRHKTEIVSSADTPTSPLIFQIPEVLERILYCLDVYSSAFYVCRLWYTLSKPLIPIRLSWSDYHKFAQRGKRIAMDIEFSQSSQLNHRMQPGWSQFISALNKNQNDIFELIVHGHYLFTDLLNPILSRFETLTSLMIRSMCSKEIQLCFILEFCPSLLRLSIDMPDSTISTPEDITAYPNQVAQFDVENHKIKSIIIKHAAISQQRLRAILECCTELQELLLIEISSATWRDGPLNQTWIYESVSRSCPRLKRLLISEYKQWISKESAQTLIDLFYPDRRPLNAPTHQPLESICIMDHDLHRGASQELFAPIISPRFYITITTLEIFSSTAICPPKITYEVLHNLLCSATSLLHLIAPNVKYWSNILDGGNSLEELGEDALDLRGVWACRKLQTLRLAFTPGDGRPREPHASSRILFDYITRVCPELRVLEIRNRTMSIAPMSGFCWLARLKFLMSLTITIDTKLKLKQKDFWWMSWLGAVVPSTLHDPNDFRNLGSLKDLLAFQMHPSWQKSTAYCTPDLYYLCINLFHKDAKSSNSKEKIAQMLKSVRPSIKLKCKIGAELSTYI